MLQSIVSAKGVAVAAAPTPGGGPNPKKGKRAPKEEGGDDGELALSRVGKGPTIFLEGFMGPRLPPHPGPNLQLTVRTLPEM